MASVYFDSSVFLSILSADASAGDIRELLRELKKARVKIVTSIITIQEVSVSCYRRGTPARDYHSLVGKLARIESISREMALTAAKYEAHMLDQFSGSKAEKELDNKRRKWDCFHMACAVILKCDTLYSNDQGMLKRKEQFCIPNISFLPPTPRGLFLPFEPIAPENVHEEPTRVQPEPQPELELRATVLRERGDRPSADETEAEDGTPGPSSESASGNAEPQSSSQHQASHATESVAPPETPTPTSDKQAAAAESGS